MWLITTQGFYSVVASRDDADSFLVRARSREDIEALREQIPDIEPYSDDAADYRWRAIVGRDEWSRAAASLADEIDYPNFKNAVGDRQGNDRAHLYHEVWYTLLQIQRNEE